MLLWLIFFKYYEGWFKFYVLFDIYKCNVWYDIEFDRKLCIYCISVNYFGICIKCFVNMFYLVLFILFGCFIKKWLIGFIYLFGFIK